MSWNSRPGARTRRGTFSEAGQYNPVVGRHGWALVMPVKSVLTERMKVNTRTVLLAGAGVLVVGLIAGGMAYMQGGFQTLAVAKSGPDELRHVPDNATLVAYANVRDVMVSSFRDHLREFSPDFDGQQQFREETGIDLESDIDSVVATLVPDGDESSGLVLLNGRFDPQRLERLARQHGGHVEEYSGQRLFTRVVDEAEVSMSFVEPGVLALGSAGMVRGAIDMSTGDAADNVTANERLMGLLTYVRGGNNAWAVAEFERMDATSYVPEELLSQVPPITAMAVSGRVNGGLSGTMTVETRDEQSGQDLHAVVQGLVALARLRVGSRPDLRGWIDSVQLVQAGNSVTLEFDLPPEILELAIPEPQDVPR